MKPFAQMKSEKMLNKLEGYMNTKDVLVSSNRIIAGIATCFLVMMMFGVGDVISQETKMIKKQTGPHVEITTYTEIPEATEPCTPLECEWWKQMREAGNDLLRKGDDKTNKKYALLFNKYALLFVEGIEKAYRIPLSDRPPQALVTQRAAQSPRDIIPKNGKVELLVEVRADGSVGEVRVVKGLRSDMDQSCIQSRRQSIYLPAVRDRVFATEWQKATCTFWSRKGV